MVVRATDMVGWVLNGLKRGTRGVFEEQSLGCIEFKVVVARCVCVDVFSYIQVDPKTEMTREKERRHDDGKQAKDQPRDDDDMMMMTRCDVSVALTHTLTQVPPPRPRPRPKR